MSEPARRFVEEVRQAHRHRKFAGAHHCRNHEAKRTPPPSAASRFPNKNSCPAPLTSKSCPFRSTTAPCDAEADGTTTTCSEPTPYHGPQRSDLERRHVAVRTTLLEPRKLNKSQWEGWGGTGRNGILKIGSLAGLEPATSCVLSTMSSSLLLIPQALTNTSLT